MDLSVWNHGPAHVGHLLEAGYELAVFDIVKPAVDEMVAKGAKACSSCKEVAQVSDVVISMVPDSPDVEKVALGEGGIIEAAREGLIYIDMSSIAPKQPSKWLKNWVKKVWCAWMRRSAGEKPAPTTPRFQSWWAVPRIYLNKMLPIFEIMGKTITLCGKNGAGQTVKACNQIQVAMNFIGMAEALVLGTKAGVDPAIIVKVSAADMPKPV